VNTLFKAGIATFINGGGVARGFWPTFLVMLFAGGLALPGLIAAAA